MVMNKVGGGYRKAFRSTHWRDVVFDIVCYGFIIALLLVVLFPLLNIISSSFSSPVAVVSGRVSIFPVEPTFMAYQAVFESDSLMRGFFNSFYYMIVGTIINVVLTVAFSFPLSRSDFAGRKILMFLLTFTMYFNGGLIPTYVLISQLKMVNTIWALVIPGAVSAYFVIVSRTFFQTTIPNELIEAAYIDGCSDIRLLVSVVLPNSKAIIAVMALMFGVGHWNNFFSALIYIDTPSKYPLQLVLRDILVQNSVDKQMMNGVDVEDMMIMQYLSELLKYAVIVVSTVPMMILYPFVQKYFVQGVMIGSLKG